MRTALTCAAFAISSAFLISCSDEGDTSKNREFRFGEDIYVVGSDIEVKDSAQNLFVAGQNIRLAADSSGSVHAAGKTVEVAKNVAGNIYAMGQEINVRGIVAGNASIAAQRVSIDRGSRIEKSLRAAGQEININGDVLGYALLAGQKVALNSRVAGDVKVAAQALLFGEQARIDGTLTYYSEKPIYVPASVIDPARVRFEKTEGGRWQGNIVAGAVTLIMFALFHWIALLLLGLLLLLAAPDFLEKCRAATQNKPVRTGFIGLGLWFLYFALLITFAITIIGLPLAFILLFTAPFLAMMCYLVGAYNLTFIVWPRANSATPMSFWARFGVFALGLTIICLIGLIPMLGGLFAFIVFLLGSGSAFISAVKSKA